MPTSQRPLTASQTSELRGYVLPGTVVGRIGLFVLAGCFFATLLRSLIWHIHPGAHFLWWVGPAAALLLFLFLRAHRWTGGPELRRQIQSDLQNGVLLVHHVSVVEAIEIAEEEDEGPGYFLKTSDGRVLAFTGQYLDRLKHSGFPWKEFEIVEAPASKLCFSLKKVADSIAPSFIRAPLTSAEYKLYSGRNYRELAVDFESLKLNPARP